MILYTSDRHAFADHSYDQTYSAVANRFQHKHTFDFLDALFTAQPMNRTVSSCIDIGCGQGQVLEYIWKNAKAQNSAAQGEKFIGVDVSPEGISQSNQRCNDVMWAVDAYQSFLKDDRNSKIFYGNTDLIVNKGGLTFISSEEEFIKTMTLTQEYLSNNGGYFYIQNKRFYTKWNFKNCQNWHYDIFYWMNKIFGHPVVFENDGYYGYFYSKNKNHRPAHELGPVQHIEFKCGATVLNKINIGGDTLLRNRLLALGTGDEHARESIFKLPKTMSKIATERHLGLLSAVTGTHSKKNKKLASGQFSIQAADGKFSANYFIKNSADVYSINYYPIRITSSRHLVKHIYHLLSEQPDIVLIPPLQDEHINSATSKPKIDPDETRTRLNYICDVCAAHNTIPLFLVAKQASYSKELAQIKQQLIVVDENERRVIANNILSVLDNVGHEEFFQRNLNNLQLKPLPDTTTALYYNGDQTKIELSAGQYLYLACGIDAFSRPDSDSDEGSEAKNKSAATRTMHTTGGRNEFEIYLQYRICNHLETNHYPGQKNVMVAGDSIRMRNADAAGYILPTYEKLKNKCNLVHLPYNCGGTIIWKNNMHNWFSETKIDLIHLNAGLHDLAYNLNCDTQPALYVSPDQYAENLTYIIDHLRSRGIEKIIWALNTPVQEQWHRTIPESDRLRKIGRRNATIELYNSIATEVMNDLGIIVNDLYTPMVEIGIELCVIADGVHLSSEGSEHLSTLVANKILACIDSES